MTKDEDNRTLDMKIFSIRTNRKEFFAGHTEEFDGTILELLEYKIKTKLKEENKK